METSLHRQLKRFYAGQSGDTEVRLGRYRIDAILQDQLIEIQHGSLAAIRDKVRTLVRKYQVLVVKPIVARKLLVQLDGHRGRVLHRRLSPKRGDILDLFDELVYFTRVFPHPNLALEAPLVKIEEWRFPGHGRRRRWRSRDYQIQDQKLVEIAARHRFQTPSDLFDLVARRKLPNPFHTGHLAQSLGIERWVAQRIAYCFRNMGAIIEVGKQGNARLYQRAADA